MANAAEFDPDKRLTLHGEVNPAEPHAEPHTGTALHVVCLGGGGGPSEDNVTGFLVRSLSSGWSKGSLLAVDAGSHLAAITRILEHDFPVVSLDDGTRSADDARVGTNASLLPVLEGASATIGTNPPPVVLQNGPFAGVPFHNRSARANALQLLHTYISCYLITHPHLDHLSGFAINTAALHGKSKPKTLAALPGTVDAVKRHIFNDVIWPNLSDEDGGVGFVTFQRLKEGGDPMVGEGEARGYIDVCDGLSVKSFKVSHGVCTKTPPSHHHRGSLPASQDVNGPADPVAVASLSRSASMAGMTAYGPAPDSPASQARQSFYNPSQPQQFQPSQPSCVVDSTAFFLRDEDTSREILMFGDVEPDAVSLQPRNERIWAEAARKIVSGTLKAIFIECSYSDAVSDESLFGHLCPRHLIRELQTLGDMILGLQADRRQSDAASDRKRKRSGANGIDAQQDSMPDDDSKQVRSRRSRRAAGETGRNSTSDRKTQDATPQQHNEDIRPSQMEQATKIASSETVSPVFPPQASLRRGGSESNANALDPPLASVTVVIIHVKDTFKDGPPVSETILAQLEAWEQDLKGQGQPLGCTFVISRSGESYWF